MKIWPSKYDVLGHVECGLLNSVTSFEMVLEVQNGCNKNILTVVWNGWPLLSWEGLPRQTTFTKGTCTQWKKVDSRQNRQSLVLQANYLLSHHIHTHRYTVQEHTCTRIVHLPHIHTTNILKQHNTIHTNMYMWVHTNTYMYNVCAWWARVHIDLHFHYILVLWKKLSDHVWSAG